jgi:protein-tyrosine-phosphatase
MTPKMVLFACTLNRHRSVAAEYFLRAFLKKKRNIGSNEIEVVSAGLGYSENERQKLTANGRFWDKPVFGLPPFPYVTEMMRRRDFDVSEARSREITPHMTERAGLIIVFTEYQKDKICSNYPLCEGKVFTIQEFVGYDGYLVGRDRSFLGVSLNDELRAWNFSDVFLEGSTTEIEQILWWRLDEFVNFLRPFNGG